MPIALYGNLAIFGATASVAVAVEERAKQTNAYPGVDGREFLDLGGRGALTHAAGIWIFPSELIMSLSLATWRAMMDGTERTLIDTLGQAWPGVVLGPYKLEGRRLMSASTGQVWQRYSATLWHTMTP